MLLDHSPEYWAHRASVDELHEAAMAVDSWTDELAEILDFAYRERTAQIIQRTRPESVAAAEDLADHMARIAHDTQRDALDALERPYFARWRLLMEMLHRCAERLELPDEILERKHVKDILRRIHRAGGRVPQRDLDALIANEGQRSATLKLMETWDLVERVPGPGNSRLVLITDLGRLAIGEDATTAATRGAVAKDSPRLKRFCEYMSVAS
jgi:hypothetical protein